MRSLITIIASLLLIGSCTCDKCQAQTTGEGGYRTFDANNKVTGASNGAYRGGQTIDLPTGRERLQLTVAVPRTLQTDQIALRVAGWFTGGAQRADNTYLSANPRLRSIQDQTAYHYIFTDDPNWAQTARAEMLGTGLTVMLTGPDGKIMRDGSGGLLMGAKELAALKSADEMADYLLAGTEKYTRPPMLQGLVQGTDYLTRVVNMSGDCPDCPPIKPPSNDSTSQPGRLSAVVPNLNRAYDAMYALAWGVGGMVVLGPLAALALVLRFRKRIP